MQTNLSPEFKGTPDGDEAEAILRKCVHCGFCTATCPTYQLLGDELDGPRGRIYLIKQMLEGEAPTEKTQMHLDRCLTCRNCESTCPSGVEYGHLVDIGRRIVEEKVPRGVASKAVRWSLKEGLTSKAFAPAMAMGKWMRPMLPSVLKDKVPAPQAHGQWPTRTHARKMLMLGGCVQPSMMPNVNFATARVLDACEIQSVIASSAGCCGALKFHLNDQAGGLAHMRANIDAWWPFVESGAVEAIVMNASGCGVTVKEYGHHLRNDALYAAKAARISELTRDLSELLPDLVASLKGKVTVPNAPLAYHPPCTLQHGQQLRGGVERGLSQLGFDVRIAMNESHLCCGSAGTYSVLEPEISHQLRDRKLSHLAELKPAAIISANVGCISHLQSGTQTPVRHWIEVLDAALSASPAGS
ncbi:MAG: glycolate oxidase subunit GlcF [Ramlibacter sp.]|nr:glycolate oxidase subunit GlcF [Ramlibacter sp.]